MSDMNDMKLTEDTIVQRDVAGFSRIELTGRALSVPELKVKGDRYEMYKFTLGVKRMSEHEDKIIIMAEKRTLEGIEIKEGERYTITGAIRSYKNEDVTPTEGRMLVCVLAKTIDREILSLDNSKASVEGVLLFKKESRLTKNKIYAREFTLKVDGAYNNTSYIPCVCWDKYASDLDNIEDGSRIAVTGRFQSRDFTKRGSDVKHTCYELAVNRLTVQ